MVCPSNPFSVTTLYPFTRALREGLFQAASIEVAAQSCLERLWQEFGSCFALARIYVTVPFGALPEQNRAFVQGLAADKGITAALKPATAVFSLMGTQGQKAEWCDRRASQGHIGIPLATADFIQSIPMVARLFQDFGLSANKLVADRRGVDVRSDALTGVFYVPDAATARDTEGRHIIPAREFVEEQKVRTVFGTGGAYIDGTLMALICFARQTMSREQADAFSQVTNTFKSCTGPLVARGAFFS